MNTENMTPKMAEAVEALRSANGEAVVLPVITGSKLVAQGIAVADGTSGHGKARAAYVLA